MSNVNSLKKLDKTIIIEAKKILYVRKKLQVSNPYNLLPARKLIGKNEFIIPLAALVGAPLCERNKKEAISVNYESIKILTRHLFILCLN